MIEAAKRKNIFFQYLIWHFFDMPKGILKAWKNFLLFNLNYFSLVLIIKTFFSHWKKYRWSYGRGFDFKIFFEALFSNLISRILGVIIRSILIIICLIFEVFIFLLGLALIIVWLISPLLLITALIFGFRIILI